MRVYDSAPSEPVRRDVRRIAAQLHLPTPTFIKCPRQARGTNECGLFAMANIILCHFGFDIASSPHAGAIVSLAHWRPLLLGAEKPHTHRLLDLALESYGLQRIKVRSETRWQHHPYGGAKTPSRNHTQAGAEAAFPTVPARLGGGPLPSTSSSTQTTSASQEQTATVIDVDLIPAMTSLASELTTAKEFLADAIGLRDESAHHPMRGDDLDTLMKIAAEESTSGITVFSVVERNIPPGTKNFLRPVFVGLTESGHYTLLHVDNRGFARLLDSVMSFRPGEAIATAASILGHNDISAQQLPAQGTNECGFSVLNAARRILSVSHVDNPAPGCLRRHYAPLLIRLREDSLRHLQLEHERLKAINHAMYQQAQRQSPSPTQTDSNPSPSKQNTLPARTQANSIIGMPVAAPSRHVENLEVLALLDNQDFPRRNSAHLLPQTGVDPFADTIRATRSMRLSADVAAQGTGITELDQVIFEQSLRATQPGDRVSCTFVERPDEDGRTYPSRTWTGTIVEQYDEGSRCVTVLWDKDCPGIKGSRRAPLPEANLPDPEWAYLDLKS
jgi:hypothetical protein